MFYVVFFLVLDFGGLVLNFGGLVLNFGGLVLNIGGFWKPLNPYSLVGAFFSLSRAGANQIL